MRSCWLLLAVVLLLLPEQLESRRDANQKLKACCARQKTADKECKRKFCDFNALSQNNMLYFLNHCSPRNETVKLMFDCASSRQDHTKCCKKNKVQPACMVYCEANKPVPRDYLKYLFCLQNFDGIRNCFRDHLSSHANIFGDS